MSLITRAATDKARHARHRNESGEVSWFELCLRSASYLQGEAGWGSSKRFFVCALPCALGMLKRPLKKYLSDFSCALAVRLLGMAPFAVGPFRSRYRSLLSGPPLGSFHHTRVCLTAKDSDKDLYLQGIGSLLLRTAMRFGYGYNSLRHDPGFVSRQRQNNSQTTSPSPSLVRRGALSSLFSFLQPDSGSIGPYGL